ncbi:MAG: MqnA/MqnD/SBP family protein, partial [Bacteroidota bacterium]
FVSLMASTDWTDSRLRVAVWPGAASQVLGSLLADTVGGDAVLVAPHEAADALSQGLADFALVPTLSVLRNPDAYVLAPGVGLVGEASPTRVLALTVALDAVETVAFDPRWAQEALIAQLVLREHFDARPAFKPVPSDADTAGLLAEHGAALVAPEADVPETAVVLDLGREWADLTTRPMVWGLVAARSGLLTPEMAETIAENASQAGDPTGEGTFQISLTGLGYAGLEAFADHLFYTGTLAAIPELPFARVTPPEADEIAASMEPVDASGDDAAASGDGV